MPHTSAPTAATATTATAATPSRTLAHRLATVERRRQILETARELLDTESIDDISVEAVAKHAGVSPGPLFHYYRQPRDA